MRPFRSHRARRRKDTLCRFKVDVNYGSYPNHEINFYPISAKVPTKTPKVAIEAAGRLFASSELPLRLVTSMLRSQRSRLNF